MTAADARLWGQIVRLSVVAFGFGTIAWRRWRKRRLESLAQGWPAVDGRLHDGQVEPIPNTRHSLVTFTYDYFIGEYQSGTYTHEFSSEMDAEAFVDQVKGKRVPIRYNPEKPDESVLEDADVQQLAGSLSA